MSKYKVGDIYSIRVEFEEDPQQAKIRPVVILYIDDNEKPVVAFVHPITSKAPQDPPKYHDNFKVEIRHWREAGLRKPSWVKSNRVIQIDVKAFITYIGHMNDTDLLRLLELLD
ncbi:type II toxin-antitoxin system PemK/MazF family toxin [Alicyclobacillus dauci]|uniref:Type II toxin-antitoxin system PemK/MazF family toxin n=1 Tax=Alicyclobacillus dauci TaxID=1475485 RepID=A0ABY6ZB88_9BACL|nr:type II toxin-antitoxin system PemK/MazF family toxin [Alicyclobacillus dauci]WAH36347.1 type II toxin-antitoxin system PemK/MazF family toxin [Alicyclobacillus dauci]WAH39386.1 type II toxin-antitoxin system PemK/MazF family toxin [Alicyclobacillus dauci]